MDTPKRIAAVRQRLRELQTDEQLAERAGQPCLGCVHMTKQPIGFPAVPTPHCGHIAYAKRTFDRTKGQFDEQVLVTTAAARADDGLCGPEGLLFQAALPPALPLRIAHNAVAVLGGVGLLAGAYGVAVQLGLV